MPAWAWLRSMPWVISARSKRRSGSTAASVARLRWSRWPATGKACGSAPASSNSRARSTRPARAAVNKASSRFCSRRGAVSTGCAGAISTTGKRPGRAAGDTACAAGMRCKAQCNSGNASTYATTRPGRQASGSRPGQANAPPTPITMATSAATPKPCQAWKSRSDNARQCAASEPPSRSSPCHSGQVRHKPISSAPATALKPNAASRLPLWRNASNGQASSTPASRNAAAQTSNRALAPCNQALPASNGRVPRHHETASASAGWANTAPNNAMGPPSHARPAKTRPETKASHGANLASPLPSAIGALSKFNRQYRHARRNLQVEPMHLQVLAHLGCVTARQFAFRGQCHFQHEGKFAQ